MSDPTITQADRDMATLWKCRHLPRLYEDAPASLEQAFARHREQAVAEKDAEIARLAEVLAQIAYEGPDDPAMLAHDILKTTARPICQPKEQDDVQ